MRAIPICFMLWVGHSGCGVDHRSGVEPSREAGVAAKPSGGFGGDAAAESRAGNSSGGFGAGGESVEGGEADAVSSSTGVDGGWTANHCVDDPELAPPNAVCIEAVKGWLLDEQDVPPAANSLVSVCGPRQCSPATTDDGGGFSVAVNLRLLPSEYSVLSHTRPDFAGFYHRLPANSRGPQIDLGTLRLVRMRVDGELINVQRDGAPAQSVTSGEVTLHIPEAVFVRVDVESSLLGEEGRRFRAQRIPPALHSEFVDPALRVVALYALEPFEAHFEMPTADRRGVDVRLSFQNAPGLAAGALVEVVALGSYLYPEWVTPAAFEPVATGRVSADGARIELDAGQGVPYLTWIGIRPAAN